MQTKLYRSPTDKMIAGVCGGLGTYLAIDPVLIRLFFVLLTLGGGSGIVIYMIMWILIPYPDQNPAASAETIKAGAEEIAARGRALGDDMRVTLQGDNPSAGVTFLWRWTGRPTIGMIRVPNRISLIGGLPCPSQRAMIPYWRSSPASCPICARVWLSRWRVRWSA